MSILEMMNQKIRKRTLSATERLRELAQREAGGKGSAADAENLEKLLHESAYTAADYGELVSLFRRRDELQKAAAGLDAAGAAVSAARAALAEHTEETKRVTEERKVKLAELRQQAAHRGHELETVQGAIQELGELEYVHRDVFGLGPYDLDRFSLSCGGNGISTEDPSAPRLFVDRETFERESARRRELMGQAVEKQRAENAAIVERWRRKWAEEGYSTPPPKADPPKLIEQPTWASILRELGK